jgi:4-hydroxybenzoate polyprenyltransferase
LFNVKQWVKNLLIFVPSTFAVVVFTNLLIHDLVIAFLSFSIIASAIYLFNDIIDKKEDALHPTKKNRPIASNQISIKNAIILLVFLVLTGSIGMLYLSVEVFLYASIYIIINLLYSLFLKRIPLLDLLSLLSGYIIRLFIGGAIANVPLTSWLFVLILLIATYLILFKRYSDVLLSKNDDKTRFYEKLPTKYILTSLGVLILITYVSYILLVYQDSNYFILALLSIPITGFAQYRYHRSMISNPHQEPLSVLHKDFLFTGTLFIWATLMIINLYL